MENWVLPSCPCPWWCMASSTGHWITAPSMQLGTQSHCRRNFGSKIDLQDLLQIVEACRNAVESQNSLLFPHLTFRSLLCFCFHTQVLNKASRQREPLVARVAVFQLCPVTAKFLQLRCGSLLEEPTGRSNCHGCHGFLWFLMDVFCGFSVAGAQWAWGRVGRWSARTWVRCEGLLKIAATAGIVELPNCPCWAWEL